MLNSWMSSPWPCNQNCTRLMIDFLQSQHRTLSFLHKNCFYANNDISKKSTPPQLTTMMSVLDCFLSCNYLHPIPICLAFVCVECCGTWACSLCKILVRVSCNMLVQKNNCIIWIVAFLSKSSSCFPLSKTFFFPSLSTTLIFNDCLLFCRR